MQFYKKITWFLLSFKGDILQCSRDKNNGVHYDKHSGFYEKLSWGKSEWYKLAIVVFLIINPIVFFY